MPRRAREPRSRIRPRMTGETIFSSMDEPAGTRPPALAGDTASLSPGEIISSRALSPRALASETVCVSSASESLALSDESPAGEEPDSEILRLRKRLTTYGDVAISALSEVAASADKDTARVAAANAILDRIGLVRPREQVLAADVPSAMIANALAGFALVVGKTIAPEALSRIRDLGQESGTQVSPAGLPARPASGPNGAARKKPKLLTPAFTQEGEP